MSTMEYIAKTQEYLNYLKRHIENVNKAWVVLQDKCKDLRFIYDDYVYHNIRMEVEIHDLSKLSLSEFVQYRQRFYPVKDEPICSTDFGEAWEHHKLCNGHHWENWTVQKYYNPYEAEMHCVHMVIDWMAMGFEFDDNAQKYYEKNKDKIELPDWAVKFIYEIFERLYRYD